MVINNYRQLQTEYLFIEFLIKTNNSSFYLKTILKMIKGLSGKKNSQITLKSPLLLQKVVSWVGKETKNKSQTKSINSILKEIFCSEHTHQKNKRSN